MSLPNGVSLKVGPHDLSYIDNLNLEISDTTPGGFDTATFETDDKALLPYLKLGNRVVCYDASYNKWPYIGRVRSVRLKGYCASVTCSRPTRDRKVTQRQVYPIAAQIDDVIEHARAQWSSVEAGDMTDTGIQLLQDSQNFSLQTFEDIINAMTALTTQFSTPLSWWIRGRNNIEVLDTRYVDPISPRYRVRLPLDQVEQNYDLETITNEVTIGWGKDGEQFAMAAATMTRDVAVATIAKTIASNRTVGTFAEAIILAEAYLARFNEMRDTGGSILIKCDDRVRAMPPVVIPANDDYPHWLVESGWCIDTGYEANLAPFNKQYKLVVGKRYNFTSEELTLTTGELLGLDSTIDLVQSFNTDRLYKGALFPMTNWPLPDADLAPVYGPAFNSSWTGQPAFSAGMPIFIDDPNSARAPDGKSIHPNLIADEGIEVNFAFDVTSTGFKGGTWSIPGTYNEVKIQAFESLAGSEVQDSFTLQLWHKSQGQAPVKIGGLIQVVTTSHGEYIRPINQFSISDRKGIFIWEVIVPATTADVCTGDLHGKKLYPGLRV